MAEEKKHVILFLARFSRKFWELTPKQFTEIEEFDKKWREKKRSTIYQCVGMGKWDIFGINEVSDIADYEAYEREFRKKFGQIIEEEEYHVAIHPAYYEQRQKELKEAGMLA